MNMHVDNQQPNDEMREKMIDAGLASFPVEPLPTGFSQSLMATIGNETLAERRLPISLSPTSLARNGRVLFQEALSVRAQIRRVDVLRAAAFALFWCLVGGSFIWTKRLVATQGNPLVDTTQLPLMITLATFCGSLLLLEILAIYFYLEQRNS